MKWAKRVPPPEHPVDRFGDRGRARQARALVPQTTLPASLTVGHFLPGKPPAVLSMQAIDVEKRVVDTQPPRLQTAKAGNVDPAARHRIGQFSRASAYTCLREPID